jgi:hypothetical protein
MAAYYNMQRIDQILELPAGIPAILEGKNDICA